MTKFEVEDIDSSKFWEEWGNMSRIIYHISYPSECTAGAETSLF